jgi:hypothetical protein
MASDVSSRPPVVVKSDTVSEHLLLRLTKEEKQFVESQSKRELRRSSNYVRSLVIEAMGR